MSQDCVFCKIIEGDIPAATLLENDALVSFLDINPVNPGHALVVPRRHAASLLEMQDDEVSEADGGRQARGGRRDASHRQPRLQHPE